MFLRREYQLIWLHSTSMLCVTSSRSKCTTMQKQNDRRRFEHRASVRICNHMPTGDRDLTDAPGSISVMFSWHGCACYPGAPTSAAVAKR
jgi:hypothetical protein